MYIHDTNRISSNCVQLIFIKYIPVLEERINVICRYVGMFNFNWGKIKFFVYVKEEKKRKEKLP